MASCDLRGDMTTIVCDECRAALPSPDAFDAHMRAEHAVPDRGASYRNR